MSTPTTSPSSSPTTIGPFDIETVLGHGGMGVVYLARDRRLDRPVAIKVLTADMAKDEERLARFRREARIIAQLNHPNIAHVHQLLEHEGHTHLVLEYVPGRSLAELIAHEAPLAPERAVALCKDVAAAVEAAHQRGIVHRDLKPENIRVTDEGIAKVLDFGIASARGQDEGWAERTTIVADGPQPLTRAGALVGTPGYMSPEQASGRESDSRADIFSFGCVLYECLTGVRAFDGDTLAEVLTATLKDTPDWSRLPAAVPERLRDLLADCLAKDPGERLQFIADARIALRRALAAPDGTPTPSRPFIAPPNNLPSPMTSFVGRTVQLEELARVLAESRLVTLTGAAGCGKTRLALELARRVPSRFPDGVFIAELAPVCDSRMVPPTLAAALGVPDRPDLCVHEALREHLARRTLLLLLDNCEHLLEAAATITTELLRGAPGLRILATSRESLGCPGETAWQVPSLTLPESTSYEAVRSSEAAALFAERAQSARPGFSLERCWDTVARMCRRLDGIPLAIELAAVRVRVLTPDEIEKRLDDRFRLLTGGARGAMERHRTLRAAIDWSYRMLAPEEQRMLRVLSTFAGGWTLEAAVTVCGAIREVEGDEHLDEFEVLDLLTRLINKSLVTVDNNDSESRYRLLETIRQYTAEKLDDAGEQLACAHRHIEYYTGLAAAGAQGLLGRNQAAWLRQLAAEHDNFKVALERAGTLPGGPILALGLCAALTRFWQLRGHFRTGADACASALARPEASTADAEPARAGALHAAGVMAEVLGSYDEAERRLSEALTLRRALGDKRGIATTLNSLGNVAYRHGDLPGAARHHTESLRLRRSMNDHAGIATSLNNLANIENDRGNLTEAERLYESALAINRETGNRAWQAINLNNLGLVAEQIGDFETAMEHHEQSLAIRRDLGDQHGVGESLCHLASVISRGGEHDRARRLQHESLTIQREVGDGLGIAESLDQCAMLAARTGAHAAAARLRAAADRWHARLGAPRPEPDQRAIEACLATSRRAMGAAAFDAAANGEGPAAPDDDVTQALAWLGEGGPRLSPDSRVRRSPRTR